MPDILIEILIPEAYRKYFSLPLSIKAYGPRQEFGAFIPQKAVALQPNSDFSAYTLNLNIPQQSVLIFQLLIYNHDKFIGECFGQYCHFVYRLLTVQYSIFAISLFSINLRNPDLYFVRWLYTKND